MANTARNWAVVIGIDEYQNAEWRLDAAVNDALAFADWVCTDGQVPTSNLLLYLSPRPGKTIARPYKQATRREIYLAIESFKKEGIGKGGDRLYFYYAGHGAAISMGREDASSDLAILPEDLKELPIDAPLALGFLDIMPALSDSGPTTQFFFLDACRDFELTKSHSPVLGRVIGRYIGKPAPNGTVRRAQYVLYATSPGQKAVEQGAGAFGSLLVEALRGTEAGAMEWSQKSRTYELRFQKLANYLREALVQRIQEKLPADWEKFVQTPVPVAPDTQNDIVLRSFPAEDVKEAGLRVRVSPGEALESCDVEVLYYGPGNRALPYEKHGHPITLPVEFKLPPSDYTVVARAAEFGEAASSCSLFRDLAVELRLQSGKSGLAGFGEPVMYGPPSGGKVSLPTASPAVENKKVRQVVFQTINDWCGVRADRRNLEIPLKQIWDTSNRKGEFETKGVELLMVQLDKTLQKSMALRAPIERMNFRGKSKITTVGDLLNVSKIHIVGVASPKPKVTKTRLILSSNDPRAKIEVLTPTGKTLTATGTMRGENLPPGLYRAKVVSAASESREQVFELRPGAKLNVQLEAPVLQIDPQQTEALKSVGIEIDERGYLDPSELVGDLAGARLGTLLALAALSAHWPNDYQMVRLRKLGVKPIGTLKPGQSGLCVLVGKSGKAPVSLASKDFVAQSFASVAGVKKDSFELLTNLPHVGQWSCTLKPGAKTLDIQLAGMAQQRLAIVTIEDRLTVVIVTFGVDGTAETRLFCFPVRQPAPGKSLPFGLSLHPLQLVRLDEAQGQYSRGAKISNLDLEELLHAKWLDPLLGCMAGYALARSGQLNRYIGSPAISRGKITNSAMLNMLNIFGDLPDSHVLAGLCEPGKADKHFANATKRGVPLFVEGFNVLREWQASKGNETPAMAEAARGLIPGIAFTAWNIRRPALVIRKNQLPPLPADWASLEKSRNAIERAIGATGRVEVNGPGHPYTWHGAAFLISPDVAISMSHVVEPFSQEKSGAWKFKRGFSAQLNFSPVLHDRSAAQAQIVEVLYSDFTSKLAVIRVKFESGSKTPEQLKVAEAPKGSLRGREVYIVGFPALDVRNAASSELGSQVGVKRLQPGFVTAGLGEHPREELSFEHDCFTLGGDGGAPVIDATTHEVLGVHHSAVLDGEKRGYATALWMLTSFWKPK